MNALPGQIKPALPGNLEVEQALLGAILMDPATLPAISWILDAGHFSEQLHQRIYEVCKEMHFAGRRPTPISLKDFLPYDQAVGGMTLGVYVAHLAAETPGSAAAESYARSIVDSAVKRKLIGLAEDIDDMARSSPPGVTPKEQIEVAVQRLSELSVIGLRPHQRQSSAWAAAEAVLADMDSPAPRSPPISTGFLDLDKVIGGFRRGNLDILAGRPGMAKSMLAGAMSLTVAEAGHGVLFFCKEMTKEELVARLLTDLAYRNTEPVLYQDILDQAVRRADHKNLLHDAAARLRGFPIIIDPQPGLTMAEIAMRSRRAAESMERKGTRLGLIACDHLGKVRLPRTRDGRNVELGDVTSAAAECAKEVDACFLMLCQLNRGVESRDNKRPGLADLRESGHIEEDADVVLSLYREAYYLAKTTESDPEKEVRRTERLRDVQHDLEIGILKNRHGAEGMAKLYIHAGAAAIRNREWRH